MNKTKFLLALVFLLLAACLLGGMLFPGYVLTLDMVFVPHTPWPAITSGSFANVFLVRWLQYMLGLVMPGWVVQKITLVALFVTLPALAYGFLLPRTAPRGARVWAALFYTVNPFVYTRFLAGHWMHVFAYALLPWVVSLAFRASGLRPAPTDKQAWKNELLLGTALALVTAFSLHLGVMAVFMTLLVFCVGLLWRPGGKSNGNTLDRAGILKKAGLALGAFAVLSLYWIIPYLLNNGGMFMESFGASHWEAFRTAADQHLGTLGNVLALYGYWGENYSWAKQFIWPKDTWILWAVSGAVIGSLVILGAVAVLRDRSARRTGVFLLVLMALALVFSCGVGDSPFRGINLWMFGNVSFWRGFRDTQKWSALLVLAYASLGGYGVVYLRDRLGRLSSRAWAGWLLTFAACSAVLIHTYPVLGGFWGQLKPVQYPGSWRQADAILKQDPNCKAVFLPWHMYMNFNLNRGLLTANPANIYFHCTVITSREVELGGVGADTMPDPAYDAIVGVVTERDKWDPEQAIDVLKRAGIGYILVSKGISGEKDSWDYDFLYSPRLSLVTFSDLSVYRILW